MAQANTLAYHNAETITAVKKFKAQGAEQHQAVR
jgi:hypothetical protein